MTKINLNNILLASFEKGESTQNLNEKTTSCVTEAMRDCSKIVVDRVLKNLSTGVKYNKSEIENIIKLTLKELE